MRIPRARALPSVPADSSTAPTRSPTAHRPANGSRARRGDRTVMRPPNIVRRGRPAGLLRATMHRASSQLRTPGPEAPGAGLADRSVLHARSTSNVKTPSYLENSDIGPLARGQSRRAFLRMLVAGTGASALGMMVAACGPAAPTGPAA